MKSKNSSKDEEKVPFMKRTSIVKDPYFGVAEKFGF